MAVTAPSVDIADFGPSLTEEQTRQIFRQGEEAGGVKVYHGIGLGHSNVPGATMWPTTAYGDTSWRTLEADDIAGVSVAGSGIM